MNRLLVIAILSLFMACKSNTSNLPDQLKKVLASHLKGIDSLAVLDSVHVLHNVPLTEKLNLIIYDSAYSIQIRHEQEKLYWAKEAGNKKGVEDLDEELNYMNGVKDSIHKSIPRGDTIRKYGQMIVVWYSILKSQKSTTDSAVMFLDSASNFINPSIIDYSLQDALKKLDK